MQHQLLYLAIIAIAYLFVQAAVIAGIRLSAQGSTEILPDGTEKDSDMILYPLYKELHKFHMRKVYLDKAHLLEVMKPLWKNGILKEVGIDDNRIRIHFAEEAGLVAQASEYLKTNFGVSVEKDGLLHFRMYKEVHEYNYSKYIRKPVIGCITCMPSFWSLFTYGLPMLTVFGFHAWVFALWVFNIPALAFITTFLYKRAK